MRPQPLRQQEISCQSSLAAIIPISESDLALCTKLSDAQADRLWKRIDREIAEGKAVRIDSPAEVLR